MALSAAMVWEVRTTGADTNGGAFKAGATGTDWSTQDAAQYSVTDGVTAGSTTITSATAAFGTDVVGNVMYVQGGTGSVTAGWYEITVRNSATSVTVDRSTGLTAGTGVTLKIGGALASPGQLGAVIVNGNTAYCKAGTYTILSASTNIATGCPSLNHLATVVGYSTTRTVSNTDTKPIWRLGTVSTATLWVNAFGPLYNITLDGNNQTSAKAYGSSVMLIRCHFTGMTAASSTATTLLKCSATGNAAKVLVCVNAYGCEAYSNTATGLAPAGTGAVIVDCLSYNNSGATTDGIEFAPSALILNCAAYGNGRHGFKEDSLRNEWLLVNCHAEGNAGYGYFAATAGVPSGRYLVNCGSYNNTSGRVVGDGTDIGAMTLSASAFTNAGAGDFSLNPTASAGALLRAAAYANAFPAGTTTSYLDVGAVQHADPTSVQYRPSLSGNV